MTARSAPTDDIPLGISEGFIASSIDQVAQEKYCVSGRVLDDTASTQTALVMLVDIGLQRVMWKTTLSPQSPNVGNYALRCAGGEDAYYVLTQEQTHTEESLNQTSVVLNKLGPDGKLLQRQPIDAGFDEWSYLLDVEGDRIAVAGGVNSALRREGTFGTFVARFDSQLAQTSLTQMDSGAFWTGTRAMLSGSQLRVAGRFFPNANGLAADRLSFAVSRIDLDKKRYLSSTYVSPPHERANVSVFGKDGTAYYVATTPTQLVIVVVSPAGKVVQKFTAAKVVCDLTAIGVRGATIDVIGKTCDTPVSALAEINLSTEHATLKRRITDDVSIARLEGDIWVGVVDTSDRGFVLRRDAQ
jgi:hypothetical protein